jgi:hypothetical protein
MHFVKFVVKPSLYPAALEKMPRLILSKMPSANLLATEASLFAMIPGCSHQRLDTLAQNGYQLNQTVDR